MYSCKWSWIIVVELSIDRFINLIINLYNNKFNLEHFYVFFVSTYIVVNSKASFTLSQFSVPALLRCGHRGPPGPHCSDTGNHRIESGYTVLIQQSPGSGPSGSNFSKQLGHTGLQKNTAYSGASPLLFRHEPYLHRKITGRNRSKPACAVSNVEMWWLTAWPLCVMEESWHSTDSCQSNYSLAQ